MLNFKGVYFCFAFMTFFGPMPGTGHASPGHRGVLVGASSHGDRHKTCVFGTVEKSSQGIVVASRWNMLKGPTNIRKCAQSNMLG